MSTNLPNFERAEYGSGVRLAVEPCARCQRSLTGRFFRLNGVPLCEPCANAAVGTPAEGASAAYTKAIGVGVVAAIAGSILYAVIEMATGWTIGYVALAVGWMVGKGMKWGAEGRGGRRYQVAAAVLTYLSVSSASVILILHAIAKEHPEAHFALSQGSFLFLARYAVLSPFLDLRSGVGGVIGLFILFIGIRAAWSLTAGSEYRITGPHDPEVQI